MGSDGEQMGKEEVLNMIDHETKQFLEVFDFVIHTAENSFFNNKVIHVAKCILAD